MSARWNIERIRLLCGRFSFEDGEALCRDRKVTLTQSHPVKPSYDAVVFDDPAQEHVSVQWLSGGNIDVACSCPLFHPDDQYCKHIAATLLLLHSLENEEADHEFRLPFQPLDTDDEALTNKMLELFEEKTLHSAAARPIFDDRLCLNVEFICKTVKFDDQAYGIGMEIKIGPKKPYVVKHIRYVLDEIDYPRSCVISQSFTYDPQQHCFHPEDEAVLRQLIHISKSESLYMNKGAAYSERLLLIPPHMWDMLLPLLLDAHLVKLVQEDQTYDGISISHERLPITFTLDSHKEEPSGIHFTIEGLSKLLTLEAYGVVLYEGSFFKLPPETLKRFMELEAMFKAANKRQLSVKPEQTNAFMEKVVPRLMQLGNVDMKSSISKRMVQVPLKVKLFLDRVKDRLLAGLEFHYGEFSFSPLGEHREKASSRILVRDSEKENNIIALLVQSGFVATEGGYFLTDEDLEYDFLYHTLPELVKLVQVYATSGVKVRIVKDPIPPKINVEWDERTDWLEFKFEIDGIAERDIQKLLSTLAEKRKYFRLPNGALMPLESSEFQEIVRFMNELGAHKGEVTKNGFRLPVVRALHLAHAPEQPSTVKLGKSFRKLLEHLRNPDHLDFALPPHLETVLRDYQKYGFQWMKTLARYRFGGILADEMGLGKTIQSIAFLVSVLDELRQSGQQALIVCPASLMYNWLQELHRFAPDVRVVVADGGAVDRKKKLKNREHVDVIITSYPLLRIDTTDYAHEAYHTLILDEAQAFKNDDTQTAKAVKQITARHRFALTGTPIENSLQELWSIYDAVFPGLFPDKKAYAELTKETISKRIRPFMLRRLKTDVLKELPEKIEVLQSSTLLPEQKKLYLAYLAELRQETLKHIHTGEFRKNRIKILAGITRLRQLCCHPALFVEGYLGGSAKLDQLIDLVKESRSVGRRILIFSQFTEMLRLIGRRLMDHDISYFYLDGGTPARERVELCSRFNEGERDAFLLSLKAGGTGLNLAGADTIILYDLWWNPAVEQQAMDRAHRIGQNRVVQVIRLVSRGTLEEKMMELQNKKKNLIQEVIQPSDESHTGLTEEHIRELLSI
ncbi:SNF2 helicase associated domain-containing protein [Marinicrinis lubricantis]|uniref:SNF2 helicase associated domain-containing protein n=1 Tax=Marinicrinis lubricantis TaxID=2086470 RepID=A0ABW1IQ35_9BACL